MFIENTPQPPQTKNNDETDEGIDADSKYDSLLGANPKLAKMDAVIDQYRMVVRLKNLEHKSSSEGSLKPIKSSTDTGDVTNLLREHILSASDPTKTASHVNGILGAWMEEMRKHLPPT